MQKLGMIAKNDPIYLQHGSSTS